jgi:hypothetical protein
LELLLILLFINLNVSIIKPGSANIAPTLLRYAGGFIPDIDVNITLLHANVLINADTSDIISFGEVSFSGNYTIFNHGKSVNMTIAAPFAFHPTNSCKIMVNSSNTQYLLYRDWETEAEPWELYMVNRTEVPLLSYFWLLCNVTIPENHTLLISYEFSTFGHDYFTKLTNYVLVYDVGTSRIWNGNITEEVNINIHGKLPDTIFYREKCNVQDLSDGKNYRWNWDNERITTNFVGVLYSFKSHSFLPAFIYLAFWLFCFFGIVYLFYLAFRKS